MDAGDLIDINEQLISLCNLSADYQNKFEEILDNIITVLNKSVDEECERKENKEIADCRKCKNGDVISDGEYVWCNEYEVCIQRMPRCKCKHYIPIEVKSIE